MRCFVVVVLIAGCGGGHGDDDGGGVDAARQPRVWSTLPDDGDVGALPDYPISAGFSEEMDPSTINASTFMVREGANVVPGTVAYDAENHRASFTPGDRLGLLGHYEATISREVRSTAGLRMYEDYRWTFEVKDGVWHTPLSVEAHALSATRAAIASDPHDYAIAVWNQHIFNVAPDVMTNRYTPGFAGFGIDESINSSASSSGLSGDPDVVIDSAGVATVAFRDPFPTTRPAARRYVPGVGWQDEATLHDVDANVLGMQVAVDPAHVVTAVWTTGTDVLANRFVDGAGWSAQATTLDNLDGTVGAILAVGTDSLGKVLVVWTQSDGTRSNVYWSRADSSGTWGTATLLETNDTGSADFVHLAVAPDGRAVAVYWLAAASGGSQFYAKIFDGTTWGTETPLPGGSAGRGSNAWAPDGTAWFAYESVFDGGPSDIVVRRYSASTGWSTPELVDADETRNALQPQLAIDPRGNVFVVWADGLDVWWNRFRPGVGWGTAARIQDNNSSTTSVPVLSVGPSGVVVVVWERFSSNSTSLYSSDFR